MPDRTYERSAEYPMPEHTYQGLLGYLEEGIPTGGFLYAVLTNDLFGAAGRADRENRPALANICAWIYNYAPVSSHGSKEAVEAWIEAKRAERMASAEAQQNGEP